MRNIISWLKKRVGFKQNKKDDFEIEHYPDRKIKDFRLYIIDEDGDTKKFKIKNLKYFIGNFEKRLKKYDATFILFHKKPFLWLQIRKYVYGESDIITFSDKEAQSLLRIIRSLPK
jgi:hypothetical protein